MIDFIIQYFPLIMIIVIIVGFLFLFGGSGRKSRSFGRRGGDIDFPDFDGGCGGDGCD